GEELACSGPTVGGRTTREKPVCNRVLDLVAITHYVVLIELNNPIELGHTVDVAIGYLWFDNVLIALPPHFKDLLQAGPAEVALEIERGPHEVFGRKTCWRLWRQLVGVKRLMKAKGRRKAEASKF